MQGLTLYLRPPVAGMRQMIDCHSHAYQRTVRNPGIAFLGWFAGWLLSEGHRFDHGAQPRICNGSLARQLGKRGW